MVEITDEMKASKLRILARKNSDVRVSGEHLLCTLGGVETAADKGV